MIVDPDMPDHWKTRLLADLLGSEADAVLALIRIWAHCQNRKKVVFDRLPEVAVKAICHYQGDPELLDESLATAGFISRDGDAVTVIGWDEHNSKMIAAWENGRAGGRPRKSDNPERAEDKPNGNPQKTQEKPNGNPANGSANPQESGKGGKGGKDLKPMSGKPDLPAEVFNHWQQAMNHPRAKLDDKRRKKIAARLKDGYTVDDLKAAVDGCKKSPHHMGQNDTRTVYDDIELICRDASHVDKFIALAAGRHQPAETRPPAQRYLS